MSDIVNKTDLLTLTTEIVAAYVEERENMSPDDLSNVIKQVFTTLSELNGQDVSLQMRPDPAVSIKKSITDDYLICLEDGKKLKMLKRHLNTHYNLTPDEYRVRWGLPSDYPMTAPNYAKKRSKLAKEIGLGSKTGRKKKKAA